MSEYEWWHIWSEEHSAWYRYDERGYTNSIFEAGFYSKSEAAAILRRTNRKDHVNAIAIRFANPTFMIRGKERNDTTHEKRYSGRAMDDFGAIRRRMKELENPEPQP